MSALWALQPQEQSRDFLRPVHSGSVSSLCSYSHVVTAGNKGSPAHLRSGPEVGVQPPESFPNLDKACDHFPGPSQAFPGDPPTHTPSPASHPGGGTCLSTSSASFWSCPWSSQESQGALGVESRGGGQAPLLWGGGFPTECPVPQKRIEKWPGLCPKPAHGQARVPWEES